MVTHFRLIFSLVVLFFSSLSQAGRFLIPPFDESLVSYPSIEVSPQLNSDFSILVWNIHKGKDDEPWADDMKKLSGQSDLFLLQEAMDDEFMTDLFKKDLKLFEWSFAKSFSYTKTGFSSGVATGSRAEAWSTFLHRTTDREPIVKTPKTVIISFYQLSNGKSLAVLNIHGMNQTANDAFFRQIEETLIFLKNHDGPAIYAGDFNTNNKEKFAGLERRMAEYGLKMIPYKTDQRKHKLDWIYYRGCEVSENEILYKYKTSDHTPLWARFNCG